MIGIEHEFTSPMANQRRGGGKDGESAENGSKKPAPQRMSVLGTLAFTVRVVRHTATLAAARNARLGWLPLGSGGPLGRGRVGVGV